MTSAFAPFAGLKVLDLSRLLPGPWASALLAEHGATVIKIEDPARGDYSRYNAPFVDGESVYFHAVNRHKLGIRLDLKSPEGREAFLALVREADVVMEAFRPGVLASLDLGYELLAAENPGIILCSLTGFGQRGPFAGAAGHDLNVAGVAGLLKFEGGRPVVPAIQMADFAAASNMVTSVLAALGERSRTGHGCWLDVAMLDSLLSWAVIRHSGVLAELAGSEDRSLIEAFGGNPRYNVYECADGRWVSVSLLETKFWARFCTAMDHPELIDPEETDADRLSTHGEAGATYRRFLTETFLERPRDEWVVYLQSLDLPCFPVYQPEEVWDDPHVQARGMLQRVTPESDGISDRDPTFRAIASPVLPLSHGGRADRATRFREVGLDEARQALAAATSDVPDQGVKP